MIVIICAFTLFHIAVGTACLGMAVRLLTPEERALWRSKPNLFIAELLCWVYPVIAFVGGVVGWRAFTDGRTEALPMLVAPILFLLVMGIVFALVDYFEDGILGNARNRE